MKNLLLLLMFGIALCFSVTSCVSVKVKPHKEKTIPPGQMKKITGSKSAKYYAPGHNK